MLKYCFQCLQFCLALTTYCSYVTVLQIYASSLKARMIAHIFISPMESEVQYLVFNYTVSKHMLNDQNGISCHTSLYGICYNSISLS